METMSLLFYIFIYTCEAGMVIESIEIFSTNFSTRGFKKI